MKKIDINSFTSIVTAIFTCGGFTIATIYHKIKFDFTTREIFGAIITLLVSGFFIWFICLFLFKIYTRLTKRAKSSEEMLILLGLLAALAIVVAVFLNIAIPIYKIALRLL